MKEQTLEVLRQAKHRAFIFKKKSRWFYRSSIGFGLKKYSAFAGYSYQAEKYERWLNKEGTLRSPTSSTFPVDHLRLSSNLPTAESLPVPKKLYLFWTGDNPLTKNRKNSFDYLVKNNDDIEVILVSNDNLKDFIVPGHPLHDCYYDLSFVHRSDYLRAYFMYHHGGAYLDIKPFEGRVSRMIDYLENHKSIWAVGEAEVYGTGEMPKGGALQRDSELHYSRTLSQMCFAFRPQTAFAAEWLTEVERRINYFSSDLVRFPARGATGTDNPDYPAPWFSLLSAICLPLCLKYYNKIYVGNFVGLRPGSIESYR